MKPYRTQRTKAAEVREMFDRIAPKYDLLNHLFSFGIDRMWRRKVVREVARCGARDVLDMATGTGDLAIALARRIPSCRVVGIDPSTGMLDRAHGKIARCGLSERIVLRTGDAERLPDGCGPFDAATVAFGVRNFDDMERGVGRLVEALRPGGRLFVLEFSMPRNRFVRALYGWYARRVMAPVGGVVSKDRAAYDYLPASVAEFPEPGDFLRLMERCGLSDCRARSLTFGIAHLYVGVR